MGSSEPANSVDPAAVNTPAELAECLNALRHQHGLSYEAMDRAALRLLVREGTKWHRLGKTTVGEIVNGERLPTPSKLRTFLAVCGVRPDAWATWETALQRASAVHVTKPSEAIRVRRARPRTLGVHAAIRSTEASSDLPPYIARDLDGGLRSTLVDYARLGGFALLIGRSSVGKTRSLYEALLNLFPDWWLVHPDYQRQHALDDLVAQVTSQTVIWLDELQRYIDGPSGLSAGSIRALVRSRALVVATMWSDEYAARMVRYNHPDGSHAPAADRDLLDLATVVEVPDSLSENEREHAVRLAATDRRVRTALEASDSGVIQVLAAGPALLRWWEHAPSKYAQGIITAAVDMRRIGVDLPISKDLLRVAVPGYLTSAEQARAPRDWLETAVAYATTEIEGAASTLMPLPSGIGIVAGYQAADFLLQHAHRSRRNEPLPDSALQAVLTHLPVPVTLYGLARSAQNRMQLRAAEQIYRRLLAENDLAAMPLSELLIQQGRIDDAIAVLAPRVPPYDPRTIYVHPMERAEDRQAPWRLADLLVARGRVDEALALLEPRAAAGDRMVASKVIDLLFEYGREERLREYAASGYYPFAEERLYDLLEKLGRVDEVLDALRRKADAGSEYDGHSLAEVLARNGRLDELRERVAIGARYAVAPLAWLMDEQGKTEEAIELLHRFPDRDGDIIIPTARLLSKRGRNEEAMKLLKSAEVTDPFAAMSIIDMRVGLLLEQNDVTEQSASLTR